jgi:hypothetical protein
VAGAIAAGEPHSLDLDARDGHTHMRGNTHFSVTDVATYSYIITLISPRTNRLCLKLACARISKVCANKAYQLIKQFMEKTRFHITIFIDRRLFGFTNQLYDEFNKMMTKS